MAFLSLHDETGWIEVVFFPPVYERVARSIRGTGPYIVRGTVKNRFGAVHVEGNELERLR
jgi:DNA polymerase III alpha subunit